MDVAVRTSSLRKTYLSRGRRRVAVQGLSMTVPLGGVHGFLGPNGSGKTTTIRMLLGLVRPDSGTAEVLGQTVPRHLPKVVDRVGAIVEAPKFFPSFTGRQNLATARRRHRHPAPPGRRGARGHPPRGPWPRPLRAATRSA